MLLMYIFYDLETSSRDFLGQILTFAFIATTDDYQEIDTFTGSIRLNRTQLPEIDAILVNQVDVLKLQETGLQEYDAAKKIYAFLSRFVNGHEPVTLAGFNSNQFDLTFLRNLMIRYGINPYFSGKLANKDVLHYAQHLAFEWTADFPWQLKETPQRSYYTFTLESLAYRFGLLEEAQSHDALEDVRLTIKLVQAVESKFPLSFVNFNPVHFPSDEWTQMQLEVGKQKVTDWAEPGRNPEYYAFRYLAKLVSERKTKLAIDLEKYGKAISQEVFNQAELLSSVVYINENKHFCRIEPLTTEERSYVSRLVELVSEESFFKGLTISHYFELTEKDWDIEYQIHKIPFTEIDHLGRLIATLVKNPESYEPTLAELMAKRKTKEDTYFLQLYNRAYLNLHPNIKVSYLKKYMVLRYQTQEMLKPGVLGVHMNFIEEDIDKRLEDPALSELKRQLLISLKIYVTTCLKGLL
jgi:DNA polymerase III epsilon subunit-like protein